MGIEPVAHWEAQSKAYCKKNAHISWEKEMSVAIRTKQKKKTNGEGLYCVLRHSQSDRGDIGPDVLQLPRPLSTCLFLPSQLTAVHLVDSHYCTDPAKFISVLCTSLATMLHVELPHVNLLSKMDLIEHYGKLGKCSYLGQARCVG